MCQDILYIIMNKYCLFYEFEVDQFLTPWEFWVECHSEGHCHPHGRSFSDVTKFNITVTTRIMTRISPMTRDPGLNTCINIQTPCLHTLWKQLVESHTLWKQLVESILSYDKNFIIKVLQSLAFDGPTFGSCIILLAMQNKYSFFEFYI